MGDGFIRAHGGYRGLLSYQKAEIVYDGTVRFCQRFLERRDRTVDQMVQAARSGKQNIVEGSLASGTSKETEIMLLNVARASLGELLTDYEDFLRVRGLAVWEKDSKAAQAVRRLGAQENRSYGAYRPYVEVRSAETVANIMICLIHQARYLLGRQIGRLEKDFVQNGGVREQMRRVRSEARKRMEREGKA